MSYPRNCWYIAATDAEVAEQPLSRSILGERVVLFRARDGRICALMDRCAHRWAALSQGRVVADEIECPYHGFRYNGEGRCTHIPVQTAVPGKMRVTSYPVREHGRWIWIWMGDPSLAREDLLPAIPWFSDPDFVLVRGYTELACGYLLLQENVIDLTHLPYVHADAGQGGWTRKAPEVRVESSQVTFTLSFEGEVISPAFGSMMGVAEGAPIDRVDWGTFASPGCHYAGSDYRNPADSAGRQYRIRTLHCVTPISPGRCHYWWAFAQDFAQDRPTDGVETFLKAVVEQDKRILERLQSTLDEVAGNAPPEVLIASDRAVVEMRRIVQKMLTAEQQ